MNIPWQRNPLLYEINTWTWLHALSEKYGQPIRLGNVPVAELDTLASWNLDAVWLMGVWERSPAGRRIALEHPGLQAEYHRALPDYKLEDIVGSPYAVRRYEVDPHLGSREELAAIRCQLAERGLRLVLDFVPNHVAVDHPWLFENPECFVQGTAADLKDWPGLFFRIPGAGRETIFAHGRDPYFPPWTDTAQLNVFNPTLRARAIETLLDLAGQCDGVRCDMAMLVTNQVFTQTWGNLAGNGPDIEYWQAVIPVVKAKYPDFVFWAEVYWDMEWELIQQGFNYAYDKRLYERLLHKDVAAVTGHLKATPEYQAHMIRFIENHDEARAASTFGFGRDLAGAVLITTLPGATLLHEGQFASHRVKLPVQLGRRPAEADDTMTQAFFHRLLAEVALPIYHQGTWTLCEIVPAWAENRTFLNLIAYSWQAGGEQRLIVINYGPVASQGRVLLPHMQLGQRDWTLRDVLHNEDYVRSGDEMVRDGLYIDLKPWWSHVFAFG